MVSYHITLSVVIPLYCEGSHLKKLLELVRKEVEPLNISYELILVDDGSTDDTWTTIEKEAERNPLIQAIHLSRNFGKESALCAGLTMTRGEVVIVMDGDLQHPPSLIPQMINIWRESGVNIVEAVKIYRGKESVLEKYGAKLFCVLMDKLSGFDLQGASDFKLIDRQVVDAWLKMGERNLFFRGMIAWLGFKRKQITFVVAERTGGQSSWTFFRLIKLAITGITAYSSIPLQIVSVFGGIFLIFATLLGSEAFLLKFTGRAVSGFTTVIILILIVGSLILISLGIIGEYIARIYEEVKKRPRYVVAQKIDRKKENKVSDNCHMEDVEL